MQFYSPQARPIIATQGGQGNPYAQPQQQPQGQQPLQQGGVQYGAPGVAGNNPGTNVNLAIGDSNATGPAYEYTKMNQAKDVLTNATSGENAQDKGASNAIQAALMERLGTLGNNADAQKSELDTQLQRGQQEGLNSLRRNAGGTGSLGNAGYNQAASNVVSNLASQRAQGIQGINEQSLKDLGSLESGLTDIQKNDLAERGFNFMQGDTLANLLQSQAGQDLSRDQGLAGNQLQQQGNSNQLLGMLGGGAGAILGMGTGGGSTILASLLGMGKK